MPQRARRPKVPPRTDAIDNVLDPPRQTPTVLLLALAVFAAVATMVAHWPALSAKALSFDDHEYLLQNRLVQTPSWESAQRFLTEVQAPSSVQGYYQPLTMISLMLDSAMGGGPDNLRVYHRTSLLLHAVNVVLVVVVLYSLFRHPWAAAAGGLLFGVHPMTVETIPWIGERKTLLAAFFALMSLIAYLKYAGFLNAERGTGNAEQKSDAADLNTKPIGRRTAIWYVLCLFLYILALMSKPTSTPLPVMILLLDVWPLRRFSRRAIIEKIPFFFIAAVSSYITIVSQRNTLGASLPTEYDPLRIPLLLCYNVIFYLRNVVWPIELSSHYPVPKPLALSNPSVLVTVFGTVVLAAALVISLRRTRAFIVALAIFFAGLLPTMGIIGFTNVVAADKYAYLPAIGLLALFAWLITELYPNPIPNSEFQIPNSVFRVPRSAFRVFPAVAVAAVFLIAAGEMFLTRRYLNHWQDTESLCRHMVAITPDAAIPQNSLANILYEKGDTATALVHFDKALRIDPSFAYAHYNYANALDNVGRTEEAIEHHQQALRFWPRLAQAHVNLGSIYQRLGQLQPAIDHYRAGLAVRPESPVAHFNLGQALVLLGQNLDALIHLREAVRLKPDFILARQSLAELLLRENQPQEAIKQLREALRYDPQNTITLKLLQQPK